MSNATKFWVAVFVTGAFYFIFEVFPTLPEKMQDCLKIGALVVFLVTEFFTGVLRLIAICDWDWEPSKQRIKDHDEDDAWLEFSVLYWIARGIRAFNKFLNSRDW